MNPARPNSSPAAENTDSTDRAVQALRSVQSLADCCDPRLPYARVLEDAAAYLGPFETLPAGLQDTLRELHRHDEELRTLATGATSAVLVAAGAVLSRSIFQVNQWLGRLAGIPGERGVPWLAPVRRNLRTAGRQPSNWAHVGRRALHDLHHRLRLTIGANDMRTLIGASGVDVREIGYRYPQRLDYVPGCEAAYNDAARNTLYTLLLGLDFIESDKKLWFLEMNLNPALADKRLDLYAGEDPLICGLLAFAQESGYRRVVAYGHRPFSVAHGRKLQHEGARRGMAVEIVDDYFWPSSDGHRRALVMEPDRLRDSMVIRVRYLDTVSDLAILSKQRTLELVGRHNAVADAAHRIPVPPGVAFGADAPHYRSDSRWPNVVGKVDELDRGMGVFFYKTPNVPLELRAKLDYVETYKIPDPLEYRIYRGQRESLAGGQRASKLRCYVLVTPFGTRYLSSIRVMSPMEVPSTLPDGLVERKQIYLATVQEGAFYGAVDGPDDTACCEMATRVGEVLRRWLNEKYVIE